MTSGQKLFTVIVGDLVGSRTISSRRGLSQRIHLVVDRLSREYRQEFHAPITLTKGIDELSGALKRPAKSYRICRLLNADVYPAKFRFAVARGSLDLGVSTKEAGKMDGPAFHTAADLIRNAKKENLFCSFNLGARQSEISQMLTEMANLLHILRQGWSKHQRDVVEIYEQFGNQGKVAKKLGISQQAVSDALRQANWKAFRRAEDVVDAILERCDANK
jgi:hypothetical protein